MKESKSGFPIEDVPLRYILTDISRWREQIDMIFLEAGFWRQTIDRAGGDSLKRLSALMEVPLTRALQQNSTIHLELINFTNRFEGLMECEDLQCETHFLDAYRSFKAVAETHFSDYHYFKRKFFISVISTL